MTLAMDLIDMFKLLPLDKFREFVEMARDTNYEIGKALEARDFETLRTIYLDASKGNIYVAPDMLSMLGTLLKNNSL